MESSEMPSKVCEIKEDDLQCSICTKVYFIPMRIQCNHTFCSTCLYRTVVSKFEIEEIKPEDDPEYYAYRIRTIHRSTVSNVSVCFKEDDPFDPPYCPLCRFKITKPYIDFKLQGEIEQMFKQRPREEWAARKAEERRKLKECFQYYVSRINITDPGYFNHKMEKVEWIIFITEAAFTAKGISDHIQALTEDRVENQPDKVFGVQNWEDINMFD